MTDPTLTERARAVLATLTPTMRAELLRWRNGGGTSHPSRGLRADERRGLVTLTFGVIMYSVHLTDLGREVARLLTEGA